MALRNAVQRRNHKERSQPSARKHLGLLEKHKDYVLRASDYNRKQRHLKGLRERAAARNPDEFYFGMIRSKTKQGVHILERNEKFDAETLQLLQTQDQNYVTYQKGINAKKLQRLQEDIHVPPGGPSTNHKNSEEDEQMTSHPVKKKSKPSAKHVIFTDTVQEARQFDPVQHFDTLPQLLGRAENRIRTATLMETKIATPDAHALLKTQKAREKSYREMNARLERDEKLKKLDLEMGLRKALMGKGSKRKMGVDGNGLPVYRWRGDRKR